MRRCKSFMNVRLFYTIYVVLIVQRLEPRPWLMNRNRVLKRIFNQCESIILHVARLGQFTRMSSVIYVSNEAFIIYQARRKLKRKHQITRSDKRCLGTRYGRMICTWDSNVWNVCATTIWTRDDNNKVFKLK